MPSIAKVRANPYRSPGFLVTYFPCMMPRKMTSMMTPLDSTTACARAPFRTRDLFCALLLFFVTLLAYSPAWSGKPIWDDDEHITKPELRSLHGLVRIWTEPGATLQYYPGLHSAFWLEHRLWGDSPAGYHLVNILLHIASAFLLVVVLRRLKIPGAWLAAALYALHPVQVESVAWIAEHKNAYSTVFFLGSVLAYIAFDRSRRPGAYAAALGLFAAGLLFKTAIVPLPLVLGAIIWWKRGGLAWKRDLVPLLPFFATAVAFGMVTMWVEHTFVGTRGAAFDFPLIDRILIAGRGFWFYLGKLVWPADLTFIYPRWEVRPADPRAYLFPAAALGLAGALWAMRRRWRAPFAALVYFCAMLIPVSGLFSLWTFKLTFVADHYQHLACIGPLALAAAAISRLADSPKLRSPLIRPAVMGVLPAALALLTWMQSKSYGDAETLYRTTIDRNPGCWMAYNNLGFELLQKGNTQEAARCFERAVGLNPGYAEAQLNLGTILLGSGNVPGAVDHYRTAIEADPNLAQGWYLLGAALLQLGRADESVNAFRKALTFNPGSAKARNGLGAALLEAGRTGEAIVNLRTSLELDPGNPDALDNLGRAYALIGRCDDAVPLLQRSLAAAPSSLAVLNDLCGALMRCGRTGDAIAAAQQAQARAAAADDEALTREIGRGIEVMREGQRHEAGAPRPR